MKNFPYKQVINRYMLIAWIGVAIGLLIIGKAAKIMFVDREFWAQKAEECVFDSIPIPVNRGDIISADGQLLATYVPEYRLYLDYNIYEPDSATHVKLQHRKDSVLLNKLDSISEGLARLLPDKNATWFHDRIKEGFDKKSRHWLIYPHRITYLDYKEVKKLPFLKESRNFSGFHTHHYHRSAFNVLGGGDFGDILNVAVDGQHHAAIRIGRGVDYLSGSPVKAPTGRAYAADDGQFACGVTEPVVVGSFNTALSSVLIAPSYQMDGHRMIRVSLGNAVHRDPVAFAAAVRHISDKRICSLEPVEDSVVFLHREAAHQFR